MINSEEIFNFFVIGAPESIALATITVILLRLPVQWNKIVCIGLLTALVVLIFRVLLFSTGIHTAIALITMALLVAQLYNTPKLNTLIASVMCFIYLNLLELISFLVIKYGFNLDIGDLAQNKWHWIFSAWIKVFVLSLTAYIITLTNWHIRGKHNLAKKALPSSAKLHQ